MRRLAILTGSLILGLAALPAAAGDFDGSRLLICAPVEAIDCSRGEGCGKGLPEDIGAPAFMRIDFANKAVVGPKRTSPILLMEKSDSQVMIQGSELGYGWVIVLDQETGKMVSTLADREGVFVLFGACTVP